MTNSTFNMYTESAYVAQACFLAFITLLISTGNLFILAIFYRDQNMRTPQYMLIASLSVSDLGVGMASAPLTIVTAVNHGEWKLPDATCSYQAYANSTFFMVTMLTLMAMTIEKYFAIVRPLSRFVTSSKTKKIVAITWLVTLFIASFPLFGFGQYSFNPSTLSCGIAFPKITTEKLFLLTIITLGLVMPLAVMSFAYIRIFIAIRKHSKRLMKHARGASAKASILHTQKHFAITLVIILALFVLSWTPFFLLATIAAFSKDVVQFPRGLGVTAYWLGYAASAWNPVVYVTRNKRIRNGLFKILRAIVCKTRASANVNQPNEASLEACDRRNRKISFAGIIALVSFERSVESI